MMKSQTLHTDKIKGKGLPATKSTSAGKERLSKVTSRLFGAFAIAVSASVFVQVVPLMFIFIGGILGIPTDAKINDMNTMIWLLTCVTMMLVAVYAFVAWVKFLGHRYIVNPKPIFPAKQD